jgi:hypothetical protein
MVFAPAVAIACLQVLGWLCLLVAALCVGLMLKQFVLPNESIDRAAVIMLAASFGLGGLGCRWGASALRRATGA